MDIFGRSYMFIISEGERVKVRLPVLSTIYSSVGVGGIYQDL